MSTVSDTTMVDPKTLEVISPFKDVFPICKPIQQSVQMSMAEVGYDEAHPLAVWLERNCILDGHTRLISAINQGIDLVPVVYKSFADENQALAYTIDCQKKRRNLAVIDILRCVEAIDSRRSHGAEVGGRGNQYVGGNAPKGALPESGRTSRATAKIIGIKHRAVEKARTILDHGTPEIRAKIEEGKLSLSRAYELAAIEKDKKKREQTRTPEQLRDLFSSKDAPANADQLLFNVDQDSFRGLCPDDVALFMQLKPLVNEAARITNEVMGVRSLSWLTPYHALVHKFISAPPPNAWARCPSCKGGKIQDGKGTCTRCAGHGYYLPRS